MKLGVIGGSGLYEMKELRNMKSRSLTTPFGSPSDDYVCGDIGGREVCFLPRHGRGHRLLPSEINHRANICGFKMMGVERVISLSAVGSLRDELRPGDIALPDQYFDRTKSSAGHTFFGGGVVAHVQFGDPSCDKLRELLTATVVGFIKRKWKNKDVRVKGSGTYVNMEGPAFSTRAEAEFHRQLGFDVIGMTSLAEAKLCREAEMCYQCVAFITDYDCWHRSEEPVSVEAVIETLRSNTTLAQGVVRDIVAALPERRICGCATALRHAIMTDPKAIPRSAKERLGPIAGKYL